MKLRKQTARLPVPVLSGLLDAGKSSLLSHGLTRRVGTRVALILHDMSEVDFDTA
jgi:G3E family GTPase